MQKLLLVFFCATLLCKQNVAHPTAVTSDSLTGQRLLMFLDAAIVSVTHGKTKGMFAMHALLLLVVLLSHTPSLPSHTLVHHRPCTGEALFNDARHQHATIAAHCRAWRRRPLLRCRSCSGQCHRGPASPEATGAPGQLWPAVPPVAAAAAAAAAVYPLQ